MKNTTVSKNYLRNNQDFVIESEIISNSHKTKLGKFLKDNDFINDKISSEKFISLFLNEQMEINMDVPTFREFYNLLVEKYPKIRNMGQIKFVSLFVNSKTGQEFNIDQFRKNAKPISKKTETLVSFFNEI